MQNCLRFVSNPQSAIRNPQSHVAGEVGFEPTNGGSKGRCLTTWRLPSKHLIELMAKCLRRYHDLGCEKSLGQFLCASLSNSSKSSNSANSANSQSNASYLHQGCSRRILKRSTLTVPVDIFYGSACVPVRTTSRLHSNRSERRNAPLRCQRSQRSSSRCPTSKRRVRQFS